MATSVYHRSVYILLVVPEHFPSKSIGFCNHQRGNCGRENEIKSELTLLNRIPVDWVLQQRDTDILHGKGEPLIRLQNPVVVL